MLLALLRIKYVYSNNTAIWEVVKMPEIFFFFGCCLWLIVSLSHGPYLEGIIYSK